MTSSTSGSRAGSPPSTSSSWPPSGRGGHVNLSPKGYADTFAVLDERTVAYLDLTGSGAETAAHLRDNRRITLMFCAFSGPPRILRLYGRGRIVLPGDDRWEELAARFPARRGARAVVVVEIRRIADSCGYAVLLYDYAGERGSTSGRRARTTPLWPPTAPSTTTRASTASLPYPRPPVTGRRARAGERVTSMSTGAGMLPGDRREEVTGITVDA